MDDLRQSIVNFSLSFQLLKGKFSKQEAEAERPTSGSYLQSRRGSRQVFDCEGKRTGAEYSFYCGCADEGVACVGVCVCVCVRVHMRKQVQNPACIIAPPQHL